MLYFLPCSVWVGVSNLLFMSHLVTTISIRFKIILTLAVALGCTITLCVLLFERLNDVNLQVEGTRDTAVPQTRLLGEFAGHTMRLRQPEATRASASDTAAKPQEAASVDKFGWQTGAVLGTAASIWIMTAVGLTGLLCLVTYWRMMKRISMPVAVMTRVVLRFVENDEAAAIVGIGRRDQIGSMPKAVEVSEKTEQRRAIRHKVDLACWLNVPGSPLHAANIIDLSEGGACLRGGPKLGAGVCGVLNLDGSENALNFIVRGTHGGLLHVMFGSDAATVAAVKSTLQQEVPESSA
jgi:hypothetical protein